jgi:hypothetical protein
VPLPRTSTIRPSDRRHANTGWPRSSIDPDWPTEFDWLAETRISVREDNIGDAQIIVAGLSRTSPFDTQILFFVLRCGVL